MMIYLPIDFIIQLIQPKIMLNNLYQTLQNGSESYYNHNLTITNLSNDPLILKSKTDESTPYILIICVGSKY